MHLCGGPEFNNILQRPLTSAEIILNSSRGCVWSERRQSKKGWVDRQAAPPRLWTLGGRPKAKSADSGEGLAVYAGALQTRPVHEGFRMLCPPGNVCPHANYPPSALAGDSC